jgi:hypothetical protein
VQKEREVYRTRVGGSWVSPPPSGSPPPHIRKQVPPIGRPVSPSAFPEIRAGSRCRITSSTAIYATKRAHERIARRGTARSYQLTAASTRRARGVADIGTEAIEAAVAGTRGIVSAASRMVGNVAAAARGSFQERPTCCARSAEWTRWPRLGARRSSCPTHEPRDRNRGWRLWPRSDCGIGTTRAERAAVAI